MSDITTSSTIIPFIAFAVVLILAAYRLRMQRLVITNTIITLLALQILFSLRGTFTIPTSADPIVQQVVFVIALMFGINFFAQILQWIFIESAVKNRLVNVPPFLINIIGWVSTIAVVLFAVNRLFGAELTAIYLGSTVLSAVIGLSLQEFLGGLFAGIVLQLESPFALGDWIEVGGIEGVLESLSWRTVTLRTRLNHHVILTNSEVVSERIVNYSRPTKVQGVSSRVTASYPNPPGKVKDVLLEMVGNIEHILPEPEPFILATGFTDNAMQYEIRYWIEDVAHQPLIEDQIYTHAWYALTRNGMGDPFGISDVNILSHQEDMRVMEENEQVVFDLLREIDFLESLTDAQLHSIAYVSQLQAYAAHEVLVKEGEAGSSWFVIVKGIAGIYAQSQEQNALVRVDERLAGDFFGEMSLLTGEARSATVKAETEMQVVILERAQFRQVLASDPLLLDLFATAVEKRQNLLQEQVALSDGQAKLQQEEEHQRFVSRIANFLGLTQA